MLLHRWNSAQQLKNNLAARTTLSPLIVFSNWTNKPGLQVIYITDRVMVPWLITFSLWCLNPYSTTYRAGKGIQRTAMPWFCCLTFWRHVTVFCPGHCCRYWGVNTFKAIQYLLLIQVFLLDITFLFLILLFEIVDLSCRKCRERSPCTYV